MRLALAVCLCAALALALYLLSGSPPVVDVPFADEAPPPSRAAGLLAPGESAPREEAHVAGAPADVPGAPSATGESEGSDSARRAAGQVYDPAGRPTRAELMVVRPGGALQRAFLEKQGRYFLTGADGRFSFEFDAHGDFDLLAMDGATGWARVPLGDSPLSTELEVRLEPLPYVRGRVVGPDGTPRAAVRIDLVAERVDEPGPERQALPTHMRKRRFADVRPDANGRFAMGPLALGEYRLTVHSEGPVPGEGFFARDGIPGEEDEPVAAREPRPSVTPPTVRMVRADLDVARELTLVHASTEVWIRWFDSGPDAAQLSLARWPLSIHGRFGSDPSILSPSEGRPPLYHHITSHSIWLPSLTELEPVDGEPHQTLVLGTHPGSTPTVHTIAQNMGLVSRTLASPSEGYRDVIDVFLPSRVPSVAVHVTVEPPSGWRVHSLTSELLLAGEGARGQGLPILGFEGKVMPLPEGHYTLVLSAQLVGEVEAKPRKAVREVDLNLIGLTEFHTTVDLGP